MQRLRHRTPPMLDTTCLILAHCGAHYALPADAVREVVWRPWLTPFAEMPSYVAGVFQLRGRMVPVIELEARLGRTALPAQPQQRVVVLERGGLWLGLLVQDVQGVTSIPHEAVEPVQAFAPTGTTTRFLTAGARLPDALVWMLDLDALVSQTECPPELVAALEEPATSEQATAAPAAITAADETLYRERAARLAQVPENTAQATQKMAVLRLGTECFGLEVTCVRAFVHLRGLTPIPGAPAHIAGHMNLHGELLTVVDLRHLLGLPLLAPGREVAVLLLNGLELGLLADAIDDIAPLHAADLDTHTASHSNLCRAVVWHHTQAVSLIDTSALRAHLLELAAQSVSPALLS